MASITGALGLHCFGCLLKRPTRPPRAASCAPARASRRTNGERLCKCLFRPAWVGGDPGSARAHRLRRLRSRGLRAAARARSGVTSHRTVAVCTCVRLSPCVYARVGVAVGALPSLPSCQLQALFSRILCARCGGDGPVDASVVLRQGRRPLHMGADAALA